MVTCPQECVSIYCMSVFPSLQAHQLTRLGSTRNVSCSGMSMKDKRVCVKSATCINLLCFLSQYVPQPAHAIPGYQVPVSGVSSGNWQPATYFMQPAVSLLKYTHMHINLHMR